MKWYVREKFLTNYYNVIILSIYYWYVPEIIPFDWIVHEILIKIQIFYEFLTAWQKTDSFHFRNLQLKYTYKTKIHPVYQIKIYNSTSFYEGSLESHLIPADQGFVLTNKLFLGWKNCVAVRNNRGCFYSEPIK